MTSMFDPWGSFFAPRRGGGFFDDDYDDYYAQQQQARYAEEMERRRRYAEEMERRQRYAEEMERRQRYAEEMERRKQYAMLMEQQRQREAEMARRQRHAAELERQKATRIPVNRAEPMDVDPRMSVPPRRPHTHAARRQQQRQLLRVMTVAATIIQRAYRRHLARKQQQARVDAARRIASWYRHVLDRRALVKMLPKLVALSKIVANSQALWREKRPAAFAAPLREDGKPSRAYLEISELMLRELLSLDEISTAGNEHIRALRKSIASALNEKLDQIEAVKRDALRAYAAAATTDSDADGDDSMSSDDSE